MKRPIVIDGNRPEVWPLELLDRRCEESRIPRTGPALIPEAMQAQLLFLSLERSPWERREEDAA